MGLEFIKRGKELVHKGDHLEAVKVFRMGLIVHKDSVEARRCLASSLYILKKYDEALKETSLALISSPSDPGCLEIQARAYLAKDNMNMAQAIVSRALKQSPHHMGLLKLSRQVDDEVHLKGGVAGIITPSGSSFHEEAETRFEPNKHSKELPTGVKWQGNGKQKMPSEPFEPNTFYTDDQSAAFEELPTRMAPEKSEGMAEQDFGELFPDDERGVSRLADLDELKAVDSEMVPMDDVSGVIVNDEPDDSIPTPSQDFALVKKAAEKSRKKQAAKDLLVASKRKIKNTSTLKPARSEKKSRRRLYRIYYSLSAVVLFCAALFCGLTMRRILLEKDIENASLLSYRYASEGRYEDGLRSQELIDRVENIGKPNKVTRITRSILAADYGINTEKTKAAVESLDKTFDLLNLAKGFMAVAEGEHVQGIELANKFIGENEKSFEGYRLLGRAQFLDNRLEDSIVSFTNAVTIQKNNGSLLDLGLAYHESGDYAKAKKTVEDVLSVEPNHPFANVLIDRIAIQDQGVGVERASSKIVEEGFKAYTANGTSTFSSKKIGWVGIALAEKELASNNAKGARKILRSNMERVDKHNKPMINRFVKLLSHLDMREEVDELLVGAQLGIGNNDTMILLNARKKLENGDPRGTLELLGSSEALKVNNEAVLLGGFAFEALGEWEKAEFAFNQVLSQKNNDVDATLGLARIDRKNNRHSEAIERLKPLMSMEPQDERVMLELAKNHRLNGDLVLAKKAIDSLESNNSEVLLESSRLHLKMGDLESSKSSVEQVLEVEPENNEALMQLGALHYRDGDYAEAMARLDRAKDELKEPSHLALYAKILTASGKAEQAEELLSANKELFGSGSSWLLNREFGRIRSHRYSHNKALQFLKKSYEKNPSQTESLELLMESALENRKPNAIPKKLEGIDAGSFLQWSKAMTLLSKDDSSGAIANFSKALKSADDEKLDKVTKAKYRYWLARAYELEGDLEKALDALNAAKELAPEMSLSLIHI